MEMELWTVIGIGTGTLRWSVGFETVNESVNGEVMRREA
jgi:hypothetical protein